MHTLHRGLAMATLAVAIVASPMAALAHGRGGGPHGGGFPDGGVLQQLIHPCGATCFEDARTCRETARTTALTCVQNACAAQVSAARGACTPNSTFKACQTATGNLHTCAASCLDAFRSAGGTCRDSARTCIASCRAS